MEALLPTDRIVSTLEHRFCLMIPGRELHLAGFSADDKDMWMRGMRVSGMGGTVSVGDETLVKEGWMWKQGGKHAKFKKRYFRLVNSASHGARLYWFEDSFHITQPKGQLPIGGSKVTVDSSSRLLTISSGVGLIRVLKCPGLGALNEWGGKLEALAKVNPVFTAEDEARLVDEYEKTLLGSLGAYNTHQLAGLDTDVQQAIFILV